MKKHYLKKFLLMAIGLTLAASTAVAQRYVVTGIARDAKSGAALGYVSAALLRPDSTAIVGSMTDDDGAFKLRAKAAGSYIVKVSGVGLDPTYKNVTLTAEADSVSTGIIKVGSKDQVLGTATVTATAAKVEQKEDTTVFNASAYRVPEGSTLEALVKQLPGVEVSDDGTIKWNGKEVKEFLVNGKDFFKGDTKIAMKNLPTELVSKIKAYDKASDYTEQTGIDDGEETTVLDISTKRQLNESWVTNVDLGYGTKDRYSDRLFATRFTDNSRVTVYGSANNVNDRGFGGSRGFGGGGGGLTATKSAGMDFSWDNGKKKREAGRIELGGNVRYSHSGSDAVTVSSTETFLTGGSTRSFGNSSSVSSSSSTNVNSAFRVQWNPDTLTAITFRPSFSHSDSKGSGSSLSGTFSSDPAEIDGMYSALDSLFTQTVNPSLAAIAVNRNRRLSLSDSKNNSVNGSLNVTRRFGGKGRNLSLRASGGYSEGKSHSFSVSDIRYFASGKAGSFLNQYSESPSKNWNYNLRLSYAEPLGKNWFAEARYEYSHKYTDGSRSRYNLDSLGGYWADPDNFYPIGTLPTEDDILTAVRDDYNSQYATYVYDDHTANLGVRYNSEAIRFNAGMGVNPERTKLTYVRPGQHIDTLITRHVFNLSPQLRFRYRFTKTSQLDIRYRGSSSQPSMTNLLAVIDNADPLNISMGNPGLKPSWTNTLRAFYNTYNADRQQGMMGGLNFSHTRNSISNRMVYDETTGVRYTRPENINGDWNARGDFMFNTGFGPSKSYTVSTFTNLSYTNNVGYISRMSDASELGDVTQLIDGSYEGYDRIFNAVSSQKNTTRTLGVGENLNLGYRTSMFDVGLNGSLNYQHARATLQDNANMDTWNFSYGANANFNFDWGMSVSTDIRMSSRRGYSASSMNTNELLWNAQLSQSFLKNRAATISLQFYDILHEQSNVSRTLSATMRSDSWNNAINAYCMVHFIYRLNIFSGSRQSGDSNTQGDRRRGPGGPGGPGGRIPMGGRPF